MKIYKNHLSQSFWRENTVNTILFLGIIITLISCSEDKGNTAIGDNPSKKRAVKPVIDPPNFSSDSCYQYVQDQVDFGPRVPNTKEHDECAEYLANQLRKFGANVIEQKGEVTAYDGTKLGMINIIGQYSPEKKKRILLCAHWDTRPWADKDSEEDNWHTPIDGANDGASGVGVLLEVARAIQNNEPNYGIDIIFFDDEDYGTPNFSEIDGKTEDWCLGSQHWALNPHVPGYQAKFGILLDMVGASDAEFTKEGTSDYFASHVVAKVWKNAKKLGHSGYFTNKRTNQTVDDHLFINQILRIPTIDIVHFTFDGYGHFHHTVEDNMENIDKGTLQAVGETVLYTIYNP